MEFVNKPARHTHVRRVIQTETFDTALGPVTLQEGDYVLRNTDTGRLVPVSQQEIFRLFAPVSVETAELIESMVKTVETMPSRNTLVAFVVEKKRIPPLTGAGIITRLRPLTPAHDHSNPPQCSRSMCRAPDANCRHRESGAMYCLRCARAINDANRDFNGGRLPLIEIPPLLQPATPPLPRFGDLSDHLGVTPPAATPEADGHTGPVMTFDPSTSQIPPYDDAGPFIERERDSDFNIREGGRRAA